MSFASAEEILAVTGCVQGAVAPLGLPEGVPVKRGDRVSRQSLAATLTAIAGSDGKLGHESTSSSSSVFMSLAGIIVLMVTKPGL